VSGEGDIEQGPLPERPLLAPWYRVARSGDGGILLEYGDAILALEGRAVELLLRELLPLLDGSRGVDELAQTLGADRRPAIERALATLVSHGVVIEGPPPADETAALCAAVASAPTGLAEVGARLEAARVALAGSGAAADELARLLGGTVAEVRRVDWDAGALDGADFVVVAPSPAELPRLEGWNERLLDARLAWLQLLPFNGRLAAIGPLYVPGETCCYVCFRSRRAAALGDAGDFLALERRGASYPVGGPLGAALAGLAAVVTVRWLAGAEPALPGAFYALELEDGPRLERHRVYRVPRCPACSGAFRLPPPLPWAEAVAR